MAQGLNNNNSSQLDDGSQYAHIILRIQCVSINLILNN